MEELYHDLKAQWLSGERSREVGLRLMFYAWMHWADPPFVTGLTDDPDPKDCGMTHLFIWVAKTRQMQSFCSLRVSWRNSSHMLLAMKTSGTREVSE